MSRAFLNRNSQNNSNSQQSNSSQQKVDYEAQMKKLDMDINNPGWNTTDISPAQLFAEEEEKRQAKANEEEELQMKPKYEKDPEIGKFKSDGKQKDKNNNNYQDNDFSFHYPSMNQKVINNINRQNEIIFAEKQKIYGFIIDDIINLINNNNYAIIEVGYIEPNSEEYNIIWEEIYKNVKIDISLMPVKKDLTKDFGQNFQISDIDIKYHNLSLKEYRNNKIIEVSKEFGKKSFKLGKVLYKLIKGQGPKILGKANLFLGFLFKSKEAGKGSSSPKNRQDRLTELRKKTNQILDKYMLNFFESLSNNT